MSKFHINKNGAPAPCKAQEGKCPLGGESGSENHFDSKEEAQNAADRINESEHGILPETKVDKGMEKLIEREELIRFLRDPDKQRKLKEKKVNELRKSYENAKEIFESADNPEDRRISGYDLMAAEKKLKESESLLNKD